MLLKVEVIILLLSFSTLAFGQNQAIPVKSVTVRGSLFVQAPISDKSAFIRGEPISMSDGLDKMEVRRAVERGFIAYVPSDSKIQLSNCSDAEIKVSADVGNFIPRPDRVEVYNPPTILNVKCILANH